MGKKEAETCSENKEYHRRTTKKWRGIKEENFWEFRRKINGRKTETKTAMIDEKGELKTEDKDIRNVYLNFYKDLFKKEE